MSINEILKRERDDRNSTDSKDILTAFANAKIMREPAIISTSEFPVTDISKIAFKDARGPRREEKIHSLILTTREPIAFAFTVLGLGDQETEYPRNSWQ